VAARVIALIAEQAEPLAGAGKRSELIELLARRRRRKVRLIDVEELGEVAAPRRQPAFLGRAEAAQMQIFDPALIEPGGELAF
jgi:hypothetical protein